MWELLQNGTITSLLIGTLIGVAASITSTIIKVRYLALLPIIVIGSIVIPLLVYLKYRMPTLELHPFASGTGFFLGIIGTYGVLFKTFYHSRRLLLDGSNNNEVNFLDFVVLGYYGFNSLVSKLVCQKAPHVERLEESVLTKDQYEAALYRFLYLLESTKAKTADMHVDGYLTFVIKNFLTIFFSGEDARFTFRQYDETTNSMKTILTSRRDRIPSPIPLNKKNLIQASLENGCKALLYSRNKHLHFDSQAGSIIKKIYTEYMTLCLIEKLGKPFYSLCIDVAGTSAEQKLHNIVDFGGFEKVAIAISAKICTLDEALELSVEEDKTRLVPENKKPLAKKLPVKRVSLTRKKSR